MASASGVFSGRSQYSLVLTVNQNSQNIGGNYSTLGVDLRINESPNNGSYSLSNPVNWSWNVDGQTASGSTTYDFRNYDVLVLSSTSINVGHNADGTKSVGFSAGTSGSSVIGNASCSGSMGLSTIPRASYPTADGDNIFQAGDTITINSNRASSGFTHTMEYYFGSASGTIGTGIGASTTWAVPLTLLNQIPNATSGTGVIRTYTYSGATLIGTTDVGITIVAPSTVVPDFTTITSSEATAGVAANVGAYVQSISTLALAITGAAGIYGSTISSYKIEVLDASSNVLSTINAASGTSVPINASGTVTLRGTVTDSRGRTKVKTTTVTFKAYAPPVFVTQPTVQRALSGGTADENGTYLRVNINATVSSLINTTERNALNYRISTRNRGTTTWTVKATTTPGGVSFNSFAVIGTYSITQAYDVLIEVYDDFTTSAVIYQVPVAKIFMHWDAGLGVGIGKYRENGALDVAGDIYSDSVQVVGKVVTDWNNALLGGFYQGLAGAANAPFSTQPFSGTVTVQGSTITQRLRLAGVVNEWVRTYNGSSWSSWRRSDGKMIATSATNCTFDPITGRYVLNPNTGSWSFGSIFPSDLQQFKVYYSWYASTANAPRFRFRASGTDNSAASYYWSMADQVNGWTSSSSDVWCVMSRGYANGHSGEMLVGQPMQNTFAANQKKYQGMDNAFGGILTSVFAGALGGYDLTAFDGFTITAANSSSSPISDVLASSNPYIWVEAIS